MVAQNTLLSQLLLKKLGSQSASLLKDTSVMTGIRLIEPTLLLTPEHTPVFMTVSGVIHKPRSVTSDVQAISGILPTISTLFCLPLWYINYLLIPSQSLPLWNEHGQNCHSVHVVSYTLWLFHFGVHPPCSFHTL